MSDDPIRERRVARRSQVAAWTGSTSFIFTAVGVYLFLVFGRPDVVQHLTGLQPGPAGMLSFVVSVVIGGMSMWLTAEAVERIHRTLWPEHPDDGHE